jgi:predicted transposase/invertase (TIGR01784 family)
MKNLLNVPLRQLDPLNDYLFYKVFGEKGCEVQLLGFLNAVLGRTGDDRFTSVEILEDKTFTPEMIGDKSVTFDVRAVLQDKTRVNVEAQIKNQFNMDKRSLYYCGREYNKSLESGGDYQVIPNVTAINIVAFDFPIAQNYHTCFHLKEDQEPDIILTNSLEIHFINMVKYYRAFGSKLKKGKILLSDLAHDEPVVPWLVFFDKKSTPELLEEAVRMNSAIQAANDRMVYLSGDEDAIRLYEVRFKAACDRTSAHNYAIRKGEEKGLVKGEARGQAKEKLEIARKMKEIGRPLPEIAEVTGLSPETIERL